MNSTCRGDSPPRRKDVPIPGTILFACQGQKPGILGCTDKYLEFLLDIANKVLDCIRIVLLAQNFHTELPRSGVFIGLHEDRVREVKRDIFGQALLRIGRVLGHNHTDSLGVHCVVQHTSGSVNRIHT